MVVEMGRVMSLTYVDVPVPSLHGCEVLVWDCGGYCAPCPMEPPLGVSTMFLPILKTTLLYLLYSAVFSKPHQFLPWAARVPVAALSGLTPGGGWICQAWAGVWRQGLFGPI